MKNENIDKKNKGLKIGIIALSIFSTILLIFNLLLCATFKDKDYQIKALESSCVASRSPRKIMSSETITTLADTHWRFNDTLSMFEGGDIAVDYEGDYYVNFYSNNTSYYGLYFFQESDSYEDIVPDFFHMTYNRSGISTTVYSASYNTHNIYTPIWNSSYLEIWFLDGVDINDVTLISFMLQNAQLLNAGQNYGDYITTIDISNTNPLIYWSSSLYNNGSMIATPSNLTVNITGVEFVSNGMLFNKITIKLISLGGLNITVDNNVIDDNLSTAYSGYSCFYNMTYTYEGEARTYSVIPCRSSYHYLPHSSASNNYGTCINPYEKVWINNNYKTLNVVSASDEVCVVPAYSSFTGLQLLKLQSDYTTATIGDTNVFSLLSGAFSALSSILSIRIIPGISIGLLIFIPLVVAVIMAIIKLIGK